MEFIDMERVFKALAEPTRCRILSLLNEKCMPAGEISRRLGIPKPTLSAHLSVLRAADLVSIKRDGTRIIYGLRRYYLQHCLSKYARSFDPVVKRNVFCEQVSWLQNAQQPPRALDDPFPG